MSYYISIKHKSILSWRWPWSWPRTTTLHQNLLLLITFHVLARLRLRFWGFCCFATFPFLFFDRARRSRECCAWTLINPATSFTSTSTPSNRWCHISWYTISRIVELTLSRFDHSLKFINFNPKLLYLSLLLSLAEDLFHHLRILIYDLLGLFNISVL